MGYKIELAKFFRGRWLTGPMLSASAGIVGSQIASATITAANIAPGTVVATDIAAGTITNDKLAANAVTEAVTTAGTFTTASIAANAAIVGTQLASNAAIAGSQLASNAAIAGSQLAASAGITGGQLATGVKGNIIGPYPIVYGGLTATKDVITTIPLGFIGSIVKVYGIVTTAAGGSTAGAGTLDFNLSTAGQVQSTGPATVTLTIANTNTLNQVISQSAAPTLQNTFIATDTFKIHYTQGTTFSGDTGVIWVYLVTN